MNKPVAASSTGHCIHKWIPVNEILKLCRKCNYAYNPKTNEYFWLEFWTIDKWLLSLVHELKVIFKVFNKRSKDGKNKSRI